MSDYSYCYVMRVLQLSGDHQHGVIGVCCALQVSRDRLWGSYNTAVGHLHVAEVSSDLLHDIVVG